MCCDFGQRMLGTSHLDPRLIDRAAESAMLMRVDKQSWCVCARGIFHTDDLKEREVVVDVGSIECDRRLILRRRP